MKHANMQDFEPPSGDLKSAIERDFGSVDDLSKKFNAKAATVQVRHADCCCTGDNMHTMQ